MKKFFKLLFGFILALLLVFSVYALVSGRTYLFKAVLYNFADIDDYKIFTNDTIAIGNIQPWPVSEQLNSSKLPDSLVKLLDDLETVALVVVKNLHVRYEIIDDAKQTRWTLEDSAGVHSFGNASLWTPALGSGMVLVDSKYNGTSSDIVTVLRNPARGIFASIELRYSIPLLGIYHASIDRY